MPTPLQRAHWRRVLCWSCGLLSVWLTATVAGIWWAADWPGRLHWLPVGFWISSQGLLGLYLLLIVVYVVVMERLEDRLRAETAQELPPPLPLSGAGT
jgi:putative solute:sodium symporter small subunit